MRPSIWVKIHFVLPKVKVGHKERQTSRLIRKDSLFLIKQQLFRNENELKIDILTDPLKDNLFVYTQSMCAIHELGIMIVVHIFDSYFSQV